MNCTFFHYFDENKKYHCTNDSYCPEDYPKLVKEELECVKSCSENDIYKYEYKQNCYVNYTFFHYFDENKMYHCTNDSSCPEENPKLIKDELECVIIVVNMIFINMNLNNNVITNALIPNPN